MNSEKCTYKPFLRWAGSKRQLVTELSSYWPGKTARYIEPFAGSACLFFHIAPSQAILGDLNSELINTYRCLKHDVGRVIECIRRMPTGKRAYYKFRSADTDALTEIEQAARFIYLNRFCFNGLYRTNLKGKFNVPYGDSKGIKGIDEDALLNTVKLLENVHLVNGDFEETLSHARAGDFVYLDPPYSVTNKRCFTEYQPTLFKVHDLERLQNALEDLNAKKVKFLVSYAKSPEADILTKRWSWKQVRTRRNIAGFTSSRGYAQEIIATNIG